jgi:hypothetical protein
MKFYKMEYKFFKQEGLFYCVPACLQSILHRRGKKMPSQKEIFNFFELDYGGINLNEPSLNQFLEKYELKARHIRLKRTVYNDILSSEELEQATILVREALEKSLDNLIAFNYSLAGFKDDRANKSGMCLSTPAKHVCLVTELQPGNKTISILDPAKGIKEVGLYNLLDATSPDERCGFYLISNSDRLLQFDNLNARSL